MTGPTDAGGLRSLVWNSKLQLWLVHICLVNSSWNSLFPGESLCQSRQWSMLAWPLYVILLLHPLYSSFYILLIFFYEVVFFY